MAIAMAAVVLAMGALGTAGASGVTAADSSAAAAPATPFVITVGDSVVVPGAPADSAAHGRSASSDSVRHGASPFSVMLRSTVLPGWGQVYNGKLAKAVIVVGGEGFLIYKAVDEWGKENDAASAGDAEGADRHMNLKVNYIWWAAVVHLLQMADAYVDAQLAHFEADFEPEEAALPGEPRREPRLRLAFRAAF